VFVFCLPKDYSRYIDFTVPFSISNFESSFLILKVRNLPLDELEFASLRGFVQKVIFICDKKSPYSNNIFWVMQWKILHYGLLLYLSTSLWLVVLLSIIFLLVKYCAEVSEIGSIFSLRLLCFFHEMLSSYAVPS
jgi:hypothetical protein